MGGQQQIDHTPKLDAAGWVDRHGDSLYAYAMLRVRNQQIAEDLVQDTLLASLQAQERFAGQSSERTWLIGVLRHKILDHVCATSRRNLSKATDLSDDFDQALFDRFGHWKKLPLKWPKDPSVALEQSEFWQALRHCLSELPHRAASAFSMRELEQLDSDNICEVLGISANNLWTQLHRARRYLRACLEKNWLSQGQEGEA